MMDEGRRTALLIERHDRWYLWVAETESELGGTDLNVEELVAEISARIRDLRPQSISILLDSLSVLHAAFLRSEVGGTKSRAAIEFRLETDLPLNAEEMAVDFRVDTQADGYISAVAAEKSRIIDLIEAFHNARIEVRGIYPRSLLAIQQLSEAKQIPPSAAVVLVREQACEAILICNRNICGWRTEKDFKDSERSLRILLKQMDQSLPIISVGDFSELETEPLAEATISADLQTTEIEFANLIANQKRSPWFDLVNAPCVQKLNAAANEERRSVLLCAASICVLCVAGFLLWRASLTSQKAAQLRSQQQAVFRALYPNKRVPTTVLARLRSEHIKVAASRSAANNELPRPTPALTIMKDLLEGLPDDVSFSVRELRVESGEIYLDVEIQNHADAGTIAAALQAKGLAFSPPTTEIDDDRVRALLRGSAPPQRTEVNVP